MPTICSIDIHIKNIFSKNYFLEQWFHLYELICKFLGAFTKFLKETISIATCVCLPVLLPARNNSDPTVGIFTELYTENFSKICREDSRFIKTGE